MFESFTDGSRLALHLARQESGRLGRETVGTEHILLGLLQEGEGTASKALVNLGLSPDSIRKMIEEMTSEPGVSSIEILSVTDWARSAMQLSLREALQMGHFHIGTEHLLLGLIAETDFHAVQVLKVSGLEVEQVRRQITELLARHYGLLAVAANSGLVEGASEGGDLKNEPTDRRSSARFEPGLFDIVELLNALNSTFFMGYTDSPVGGPVTDLQSCMSEVTRGFSEPLETNVMRLRFFDHNTAEVEFVIGPAGRPEIIFEVNLLEDDTAEVEFEIGLLGDSAQVFSGRICREGHSWVVTRETVAQVLRYFGISPPSDR